MRRDPASHAFPAALLEQDEDAGWSEEEGIRRCGHGYGKRNTGEQESVAGIGAEPTDDQQRKGDHCELLQGYGREVESRGVLQLKENASHGQQVKEPHGRIDREVARHRDHQRKDQDGEGVAYDDKRQYLYPPQKAVLEPDQRALEDQLVAVVLVQQNNCQPVRHAVRRFESDSYAKDVLVIVQDRQIDCSAKQDEVKDRDGERDEAKKKSKYPFFDANRIS